MESENANVVDVTKGSEVEDARWKRGWRSRQTAEGGKLRGKQNHAAHRRRRTDAHGDTLGLEADMQRMRFVGVTNSEDQVRKDSLENVRY